MAVQELEQKQAQELFSLEGGNQHREWRSIGCGAFLGVFQIWWRLLYILRLVVAGLIIYLRVPLTQPRPTGSVYYGLCARLYLQWAVRSQPDED